MFEKIVIVIFFVFGSYALYKWTTTSLIEENALHFSHGRIVQISHAGDNNKEIIVRLDSIPTRFRFLERFPKYQQVESILQIDNVVRIWHKPKEEESQLICRLDVDDSTVFSYADLVQSYERDKQKVLYVVVFFYTAFIVALSRYILARRRQRANQSLKLT